MVVLLMIDIFRRRPCSGVMNAKTCRADTGAGESLALTQCGKTISLLVEHSHASGLGGQRLVSVTQYTYCKNYSRRRRYVVTTECYCCSSHHLVPSRNAGYARTLTLWRQAYIEIPGVNRLTSRCQ